MGFMSKFRDIFCDIEEVPENIEEEKEKKEVKNVKVEEIKFPKKEEKQEIKPQEEKEDLKETTYNERELFQNKSTFNFPIFEEEIPTRTRSTNIMQVEKEKKKEIAKEEPKKIFRPTPIISPVYGILDKNYNKEEIMASNIVTVNVKTNDASYDYVRKKAYGTLEDELENTLTKLNEEVSKQVDEIEKDIDDLAATKTLNKKEDIEDLLQTIDTRNTTIEEAEEHAKDVIEEQEKTITDNTLEHDLFNLIDSMYDDKEER